MHAGDRRLQGEPPRWAGRERPGRHREPVQDRALVPARPVLVAEQEQPALLGGPGGPARVGEEQQAQQAAGLGLLGEQRGEGAREVQGPVAELLTDERVPLAGRVAGAEEQVDGREHAVQALGQLHPARNPVGDPRFGDLLLGPGDPCRHRRLGHQEGPGDVGRGNAADQAQGEGDAGLGGEGGVAAGEHQPEPVVRHRGVGPVQVGRVVRIDGRRLYEQRELAPEGDLATQPVQRPVPRRRGQPRAGPFRDAVPGPGLQRADVRLLRALLRDVQIARDAHRGGQHEGPLGSVGPLQRGSDRVRLHGGRGRIVAGSDQNGFVVASTTGRTSTPPPGAGHSSAISTAWSRSRASTT